MHAEPIAHAGHIAGDPIISKRLAALAAFISDLPKGPHHAAAVDAFFDLVGYLESRHLISEDHWRLTPSQPEACR